MGEARTSAGSSEVSLPSETTDEPEGELDEDDVFELLSSQRRRYALHYLNRYEEGETVTLNDVTERVVAWETDADPEEVDYAERKSVRNSLHQFHLPKLDDKGVVEYDAQRSEVTVANGDGVDVYMEVVSDREIPWGEYFLGLAATSVAVFAGVATGLLDVLAPTSWLAFVVTAVALSSVAFVYDSKYSMQVGTRGPPPEIKQR